MFGLGPSAIGVGGVAADCGRGERNANAATAKNDALNERGNQHELSPPLSSPWCQSYSAERWLACADAPTASPSAFSLGAVLGTLLDGIHAYGDVLVLSRIPRSGAGPGSSRSSSAWSARRPGS